VQKADARKWEMILRRAEIRRTLCFFSGVPRHAVDRYSDVNFSRARARARLTYRKIDKDNLKVRARTLPSSQEFALILR